MGEKKTKKNEKKGNALSRRHWGLVGDQSDLFPTLRLHPKSQCLLVGLCFHTRILLLLVFFLVSLPALEPEPGRNNKKKNNKQPTHPPIHPSILHSPTFLPWVLYLPLEQWNFEVLDSLLCSVCGYSALFSLSCLLNAFWNSSLDSVQVCSPSPVLPHVLHFPHTSVASTAREW